MLTITRSSSTVTSKMKTLETSKTSLVTNRNKMGDSKIKTLINLLRLSELWWWIWSHRTSILTVVNVVTVRTTNIKTTSNRTNKTMDIRIVLTVTHTPTRVLEVVQTSKDRDTTIATKICNKSKTQLPLDSNQCLRCQCQHLMLCQFLFQVHHWATQLNPLTRLLHQVTH